MGNSVSAAELARMLAGVSPPIVVDARKDLACSESGLAIPATMRIPPQSVEAAAGGLSGHTVVVYCVHGHEVSQGACAVLRRLGADAYYLEGGFEGWRDFGLPVEAAGEGKQT
ncbi:rhodanese-like domain-containing protein [Oricola sp.]|uniref:rhodanese-like domain-containing protein n=1 Tax=Oricola sp. TaxID=1979950 RepID=UPI003BA9F09B